MVEPDHFPARERRRFAVIDRSRTAPMAKGRIARLWVFPGSFVQSRGICGSPGKHPGVSVKKRNFNSIITLMILVKSLEKVEKSEKCKLNFCRLEVKSTATLIKLV
jgi:hypothetical protein